jgi:hypothetical protein
MFREGFLLSYPRVRMLYLQVLSWECTSFCQICTNKKKMSVLLTCVMFLNITFWKLGLLGKLHFQCSVIMHRSFAFFPFMRILTTKTSRSVLIYNHVFCAFLLIYKSNKCTNLFKTYNTP